MVGTVESNNANRLGGEGRAVSERTGAPNGRFSCTALATQYW